MNTVLVMLNAVVLVIFIGFQFHTQVDDPALVHIDTARFVPSPVARVASANAHEPVLAAQEVNENATPQRTERYIF
ncbi:hypothetical protein [Pseudomonas rhizosphaerae]|jgi:hypothetical protein|uniref:Uncharacterized protein n=1 Tax=Pseudomonas rhizosphaerae TaxID=216142 RepID=A0A089YWS7_9PSED|nr:hypothetical protein [Pseudomonas rhizosphaerae]AIS18210.1 hypothetical protein LT40_12780 [Pseudomonas rhizosphaerae]MEB2870430.1 hypothetical protein [Pseudomonas rhizosphaerae]